MKKEILFIIIGMSIVTQLPRIIHLVVLPRINLPPLLVRWLKHIPVAVLSALLFPSLLLPNGSFSLSLDNTALLAAIPCMVLAAKTKNLFLTVFTGIIIFALLQLL